MTRRPTKPAVVRDTLSEIQEGKKGAMPDLAGHCADMEGGLRALLSAVTGFSAAEVAEAEESIDAREYGLALQTLAAILLETSSSFNGQVVGRMQRLAGAMDLHGDAAINGVAAQHRRQFRAAM